MGDILDALLLEYSGPLVVSGAVMKSRELSPRVSAMANHSLPLCSHIGTPAEQAPHPTSTNGQNVIITNSEFRAMHSPIA
jgi:hypothetical protein